MLDDIETSGGRAEDYAEEKCSEWFLGEAVEESKTRTVKHLGQMSKAMEEKGKCPMSRQ